MKKPIVAITRPKDRAKAACEIVERLGGIPFLAPTLELRPINTDSLKKLVNMKNQLDWIIFTSPTTLESINKFYADFLDNLDANVAVIGRKTGEVAKSFNLNVDLIPEDYTAEGLVEEFTKRDIKNKIIGVPRTFAARDTLPVGLKNLGNEVILAETYKSLPPENTSKINQLLNKIENNEIDAITFTSPLTVENLFKLSKNKEKLANDLSNIITVSIGPITGKILNEFNVKNIYPETYTVPDMMELLFKTWREDNGR